MNQAAATPKIAFKGTAMAATVRVRRMAEMPSGSASEEAAFHHPSRRAS